MCEVWINILLLVSKTQSHIHKYLKQSTHEIYILLRAVNRTPLYSIHIKKFFLGIIKHHNHAQRHTSVFIVNVSQLKSICGCV